MIYTICNVYFFFTLKQDLTIYFRKHTGADQSWFHCLPCRRKYNIDVIPTGKRVLHVLFTLTDENW